MKNFKTLLAILAVLLLLPAAAYAAPVGKITYLEGNVDITAGDKVRTATLGEPVNAGEVLRSKAKAKAEVTFLDGNVLRLAEGTRVRITNYQMGEGKTTTLDLLRGKTQNIVTGLAKGAKYEVNTPTAVCGVRGTNFFTFIQNGASYFVPKENTIYGFNKNMPKDVKTVNPGNAIVVPGADQPPIIQPMTAIDIDKHTNDTAPGGKADDKDKKKDQVGGDGGVNLSLEPPMEIDLPNVNLQNTTEKDDWTFPVRGQGDVKYIAQVYFPFPFPYEIPPEVIDAQGTFVGILDSGTGLGTADMTLQYLNGNVPQLDVGTVTGQMQDGNAFSGLVASVPGSWMGAFSGIYANPTGSGLYLGYLNGDFNETTGILVSGGYLARTPTTWPGPSSMQILTPDTLPIFGYVAPTFYWINVESVGDESYVVNLFGSGTPTAHDLTIASNVDNNLLSAWAVTDTGFEYYNDAGRQNWTSRYGYGGYSLVGPYVIVGDVTGVHPSSGGTVDLSHLRISGRNLLFLAPGYYDFNNADEYVYNPGQMGYYNFEYMNNIIENDGDSYGYGGGAGTLELAPTAFGGYLGYGESDSLYLNDGGYSMWVGEEYGLIGAWTAPWEAPANIKIAGVYATDYEDYYEGYAPGLLLSAPFGSRMDPRDAFLGDPDYDDADPHFYNGDYFGVVAGSIGPFAQTSTGAWERSFKGAMAALYVKDGKAGLLTSFAPQSATGGLTGWFYPSYFWDDYGWWGAYGYWFAEGTLTPMPMETRTTINDYTLFEDENLTGFRAGYAGEAGTIGGQGGHYTYYLNVLDTDYDGRYNLPWGVFGVWIGGDDEYDTDPAYFEGSAADLSGKDIKIGAKNGNSFWRGKITAPVWTPTEPDGSTGPLGGTSEQHGEFSAPLSGEYIDMNQYGAFHGWFYGQYNEDCGDGCSGGWIGEGTGYYTGQILGFSSSLEGWTYIGFNSTPSTFNLSSHFFGILGGLDANIYETGTSRLRAIGEADKLWYPSPGAASLSTSSILAYTPPTSAFPGSYMGFFNLAADSVDGVAGDVIALSFLPAGYYGSEGYGAENGYGGYGGVFYSNDIAGTYDRETGYWSAAGNLSYYEMSEYVLPDYQQWEFTQDYAAGAVPVEVLLGGTVDLRKSKTVIERFTGEPWGIWNRISAGTVAGGTPRQWTSAEYGALPSPWVGGSGGEYLSFNLGEPVNGVFSGTVAGAQAKFGELTAAEANPESYTVVLGGVVKGIFDPIVTPASSTWLALSQGGYMRTEAFMAMQQGMSDADRANFERAMKIPTFDVGMANLSGTSTSVNGNMTVSMNDIKFFRFQTEANPVIWATNAVNGSYTSGTNNYSGTKVTMTSSGGLTGLQHTFEVKQWDTTNSNWGATVYNNGTTDTGGTLARSAADQLRLPTAPATIPIAAMTGAAAGTINTTAQTFTGTGAGTVITGVR